LKRPEEIADVRMFHKIEVGSVLADELTISATMYSFSLICRHDLGGGCGRLKVGSRRHKRARVSGQMRMRLFTLTAWQLDTRNANIRNLTICIYVSVKGRQKRATLGAVFGTPSTTPNPPL
jgi:hypothetical protein